MNRFEFIKLIIEKKSLDKEVFKKSLEVKNFPIARQILKNVEMTTIPKMFGYKQLWGRAALQKQAWG